MVRLTAELADEVMVTGDLHGHRQNFNAIRRLADLAETHQVIVITHLPQVAALAERHYRLVKEQDDNGVATTSIESVEGDALIRELCRMLVVQFLLAAGDFLVRRVEGVAVRKVRQLCSTDFPEKK